MATKFVRGDQVRINKDATGTNQTNKNIVGYVKNICTAITIYWQDMTTTEEDPTKVDNVSNNYVRNEDLV